MHVLVGSYRSRTVFKSWDMRKEEEFDIILQACHPDSAQRFGFYNRAHDEENGLRPQPFFTKVKNITTGRPIEKSSLFHDRPLPTPPQTGRPCRCVIHDQSALSSAYIEQIQDFRDGKETVTLERWGPNEYPEQVLVHYSVDEEHHDDQGNAEGAIVTETRDDEISSDKNVKVEDGASGAFISEVGHKGVEEPHLPSLNHEEPDSEVDGRGISFEGEEAEGWSQSNGSFASSGVASEESRVQVATSDVEPTADGNPLSIFSQHLVVSGLPENVQNELNQILLEGNRKINDDVKDTIERLIQCFTHYYSRATATTPTPSSSSKGAVSLENGSTVGWNRINTEANASTATLTAPIAVSLATILGLLPIPQSSDPNVIQGILPLEGVLQLSSAALNDLDQSSQALQEIPDLNPSTVVTTAAICNQEHEVVNSNVDYNGVPDYSDEVEWELNSIRTHSELDMGSVEEINGYNHNFE
ncbi:hypothetical protein FRC03_002778 [Tulasnella sp. 419]|nr:hypothetical protein FRC02_011038 [Tulasnella sp. 418]KAG8942966.1 hypothetical protein FRC03_002778 [Tulasnella sp. 419]